MLGNHVYGAGELRVCVDRCLVSSAAMSSSKESEAADERFTRVKRDPRFWEMPERERKVKIDKRFQSMFHDERFKVKYTVDKRGRPINHTSTEDLKRYYQLSDSDDQDEDERRSAQGKGSDDDDGEEEDSEAGDDESGSDSGDDSGPDLARGKGNVESSSDEDEEDDVDGVLRCEEEEIEHEWGELCKDAPRSDEVSRRLAMCNMDWDRLKAKDLLALLSSFCPEGGAVLSVKIYPSDFGKERLRLEEAQGPPELRTLPDDSEDDTEDDRTYREKMRDYQFKRLKYFYAVAECDSAATAAKIYEECDGYEYESSCSILDLRFIPDEITFQDEPEDTATDVNLAVYAPKLFTSSANATSKVQLTWDETDQERVTALSRKMNKSELLDMDFNAYLASSSDEEDLHHLHDQPESEGCLSASAGKQEEEKKKKKSEEQLSKYRQLLKGIQDKEKQQDKDMEMEVTWVPGLKETTEQLVKKKMEKKEALTPWQEFLQKKKDKKKQKKKDHKEADEEEISDDDLPPDVNLSDPFFSQELTSSDTKKKKHKDKMKKNQEEDEGMAEEELERQKAAMTLLMDDDEQHKHFNYDKIVEHQNLSKKKKKKMIKSGQQLTDDDFQVDVKDPRFQAIFTSHLFNLDPSHPSYKKTKATQSILDEKQRRRQEEELLKMEGAAPKKRAKEHDAATPADATSQKQAMEPSLSQLVKSIKSKTEQFQARKKAKIL
ncbi:ESF1 homolog [Dunckerocampus dactyliophorus]|uniref:ESF1 homolog n=1 Tax=Dunckerocampus dactyliophorus TaxID=161453 RepID=UPI002404F7F5|nr:ESF1 homolog [Dunckerocampus dactyliophorus]